MTTSSTMPSGSVVSRVSKICAVTRRLALSEASAGSRLRTSVSSARRSGAGAGLTPDPQARASAAAAISREVPGIRGLFGGVPVL